jgi:integrase
VQLERGFQCQRGFVYCVEKPSKKLGSDVKPLSASNGFIPKLDGTSWTNQRQPVEICGEIDERGQSKRVRRAFTDNELRRLVTGSGVRGIVYFVAARTGLRQEELRQLIWDDLRFDEKVPHVRVRVTCAKNKKEEHVPLVPEIAEALKGASARELFAVRLGVSKWSAAG